MLRRANQVINALALIAVAAALVGVAVMFVRSLVDPGSDPHGYGRIFAVVLGVVAIALLVPLVAGAIGLHRRQRAGAAWQVVTGTIVTLISTTGPGPYWIGIAVGIAIAAPAVPLLLAKPSVDQ